MIGSAAGLSLEACSALHYAAMQRADDSRQQGDMGRRRRPCLA